MDISEAFSVLPKADRFISKITLHGDDMAELRLALPSVPANSVWGRLDMIALVESRVAVPGFALCYDQHGDFLCCLSLRRHVPRPACL